MAKCRSISQCVVQKHSVRPILLLLNCCLLVGGCVSVEKVSSLQAAAYTDEYGNFELPVSRRLYVTMGPNDRLPVLWNNVTLFVLRFDREEEHAYPEPQHHGYDFALEPSYDSEQAQLRKEMGLQELNFSPVSFSVGEQRTNGASIFGVATQVRLQVDHTLSKRGGVRIDKLRIQLDRGLVSHLNAAFGPAKKTLFGDYELTWKTYEPFGSAPAQTLSTTQTLQINYDAQRPADCIEISLAEQKEVKEKKVMRVYTNRERWPARLASPAYTPFVTRSDPVEQTLDGEVKTVGPDPLANQAIAFEVPELKEINAKMASGTLRTNAKGIATLDLRPYVDVGRATQGLRFTFTAAGQTGECAVPSSVFVNLYGKATQR